MESICTACNSKKENPEWFGEKMKKIKKAKLTGVPHDSIREYEVSHAKLARIAAAEGIVLLENKDSILPLKSKAKIALYGAGAANTVKGGTGSGDVNERHSVSVWEGLKACGFEITTTDWLDEYTTIYNEKRIEWKEKILKDSEDLKNKGVIDNLWRAYTANPFFLPVGPKVKKTDTDTAIVVISRFSGENKDRSAGEGDYMLSREEYNQIRDICSLYDKVIVLINAGGIMDLSFVDDFSQIKGLLVISQPGMEGGNAVADILVGNVSPSGKLTDTWAYDFSQYPDYVSKEGEGHFKKIEIYSEDIFAGYKYFEKIQRKPRYCFGYGKSYTSFEISDFTMDVDAKDGLEINVKVKNTGNFSGKEVVSIYVSLPDGELEKEVRRLIAFEKTGILKPGEEREISLRASLSDLASFSLTHHGWILEKGKYGIFVGSSLEDSVLSGCMESPESFVLKTCGLSLSGSDTFSYKEFENFKQDWDYENVPTLTISSPKSIKDNLSLQIPDEVCEVVKKLSDEQLAGLCVGYRNNELLDSLGESGEDVPGSAGETDHCAIDLGIASLVMADGPAGLRLHNVYSVLDGKKQLLHKDAGFEHGFLVDDLSLEGTIYHQYCTAFPIGTMLAQTWNMKLLEQIGVAIGEEMVEFGVQLWLAPGMNIHRTPLCGRNFEYFSEDPLITGECAAALTRGVQSHKGLGVTIKHFACNNQETDREYSDSRVSERTLRELYLRGFEIAVKKSDPIAIMTSYNAINGVHSANNHALCTEIARNEFGFNGLIMTDWRTTNNDEACTAVGCILAGNDLIMPGSEDDYQEIYDWLIKDKKNKEAVIRCVERIVNVIFKSDVYE